MRVHPVVTDPNKGHKDTMTCSNCNNELMPGAQFCSRCGARIAYQQTAAPLPPMPIYPPFAYSRVSRNIQTLGILWLVYAFWRTLTRFVGMAFLHSFLHWNHGPDFPFGTFAIWPFMLGSTVLTLALGLLAAYGLLNRQPWGRVLAIVSAVFALIHPVLGTALGIYTLWVLAPAASGIEYASITTPVPPAPSASI